MHFFVKLALLGMAIYISLWALSRFPNSKISRLAFSRYGPAPYAGEIKSHYMWRWLIYALGCLAKIIVLFAIGRALAWWQPAWTETTPFLTIWAFALPLCAGIAILATLVAGLAALKAKLLGPNPTFSELSNAKWH